MPMENITIGNQNYNIKIAHKIEHRKIGFQGVEKIADNEGMLFLWGEIRYPNANDILKRPFVSMCVAMDLTIIFFDEKTNPVEIKNRLKGEPKNNFNSASRYYCKKPATLMLELSGENKFSFEDLRDLKLNHILKKYSAQIFNVA